jgi:hypothetical protein
MMVITDPKMARLMDKALQRGNSLFNWADIDENLKSGKMQGHVEGNTWAITQVHEWPRRKSVNILYVVGTMEDVPKLEAKIERWAKEIGADFMTAMGRDGWSKFCPADWRKIGTLYSKDI